MTRARRILLATLVFTTGCDLFGIQDCPMVDCAPLFIEQIALPAKGSAGVPLNAHIWLAAQPDFGLTRAEDISVSTGGASIAGTVRQLTPNFSSFSLQQFIPNDPLTPRTVYVVTVAGTEVTRFTTGSDTLDGPLAPPRTDVVARHIPEGRCDGSSGTVALSPAGAINLVVVAGNEAGFNADRAEGAVMLITTSSPITLSSGGCGNWNGTDKVRFGTLDLAGRFSGWSEIL